MQVSDKVNQEPQRDILLGDAARGQLRATPAPVDLRLVRVHQDLGRVADSGDDVDLVVCPSVFAKHAVVTGDIIDGCNEGRFSAFSGTAIQRLGERKWTGAVMIACGTA
jgi:hypothetical protein